MRLHLLVERVADALREAALHLSAQRLRVEHPADVVRARRRWRMRHVAGVLVDLDLERLHAVGVRRRSCCRTPFVQSGSVLGGS